jgi:hypothetical protein
MCAAVPWWPILFVAARENDDFLGRIGSRRGGTCQLHAIFMNQGTNMWGGGRNVKHDPVHNGLPNVRARILTESMRLGEPPSFLHYESG